MSNLHDYPFIWLLILSSTLYLYLIEDGSALGMSIALPWLNQKTQKKALSLLLPVWDINQTWLVFTLAGLYAGFSLGFVLLLGRFYLTIWVLVMLLICRGAAIEYAIKEQGKRWLLALAIFSLMIIALQGYILCELTYLSFDWFNGTMTQKLVASFFGIATLIFFDLQLGLQFLAEKIDHRIEMEIHVCFTALYVLLMISSLPMVGELAQYFTAGLCFYAIVLLFTMLAINFYSRHWIYGVALRLLAIINLATFEFLAFPTLFPGKISYLIVSSNSNALLILIIASIIFLPIIFILTRRFKIFFRNNMHDIYY